MNCNSSLTATINWAGILLLYLFEIFTISINEMFVHFGVFLLIGLVYSYISCFISISASNFQKKDQRISYPSAILK